MSGADARGLGLMCISEIIAIRDASFRLRIIVSIHVPSQQDTALPPESVLQSQYQISSTKA